MIVLDVLEIVTDYTKIKIVDYLSNEILSEYNGKDAIDEKYNMYNICSIDCENDYILIYVNDK